jgi:hypothetical protein
MVFIKPAWSIPERISPKNVDVGIGVRVGARVRVGVNSGVAVGSGVSENATAGVNDGTGVSETSGVMDSKTTRVGMGITFGGGFFMQPTEIAAVIKNKTAHRLLFKNFS